MLHRIAGLSLALTILLVCPAVRGEVVHIGISTPGLYEIPVEIAQRKAFYKEEGLETRKVVVRTGLQVAALVTGELDYSTVSGIIGRATIQGFPVKGVMGWFDRPLHILIARPGIKKLSDLKGKKIAVSTIGSVPHIILREAFSQSGMNADKDILTLAAAARASGSRR
jgi:NitT/TauT family transport system substrate-binding protein